jgi:DNA-directed RNA polymerase subunit delta
MRRIIVDYSKLTNEILTLLVEKFPDGYDDSNIIRFRNAHNELIEAVEVRTEDTIYLVKVSTKLASRLEKFDEEDDIDNIVEPIDVIKSIDLDDDAPSEDDDEEEIDVTKDPGGSEDEEDEEDDEDDIEDIANDDDDDDDDEE